ncbi:hypothetical protein BDW22DRAFT_1433453 [Trametopsis cervina]|nr:hypothetical protein BDW22DRAFT_1433453 [Trametopsis cervina]
MSEAEAARGPLDTGLIPVSTSIPELVGLPLIFGSILTMLYGVTSVQSYIYLHNNPRDSLVLKRTVFLLWIIDTLLIIFNLIVVYYYCVKTLMNPLLLSKLPWADGVDVVLASSSNLIVTGIFTYRIRSLYGRIWPLVPPATLAFFGGIALGTMTSVGVAAVLTNALLPNKFYFQGLTVMVPKLMLNSLLAMLNSRESMRSKMSSTGGALSIHLTQLGRNRYSLESRTNLTGHVNPNLRAQSTTAVEVEMSKDSCVEGLPDTEDALKV